MEVRTNKAGRNVLVNLFKDKIVCEIGTERGKYAEKIAPLASKLYVVDLWKNYAGYREHVSDEKYAEILQDAHSRLDKYDVGFIQTDSLSAAKVFLSEYLDAIYLDANHTDEAVYADLCAWYPKVKKGGIIAGHDYTGVHGKGVQAALFKFCEEHGIKELTVWRGDKSASYHFIKK